MIDTTSMYKVIFSKVNNQHDRLRTNEIKGYSYDLPIQGHQFLMIAEAHDHNIDPEIVRKINTSIVKEVKKEGSVFIITTQSNSIYSVQVLSYPKHIV